MPNGLIFDIREGTTDWNTVNACAVEDEYDLADVPVEGRLVYDLGSHVGGVAVWLATRGAIVVAVEPVPENAWQVEQNAILNGVCHRVQVIQAALGTAQVSLGPEGDAHEFIANSGAGERTIPVKTITFSELVSRYGAPGIVKLDCEGGEWAVFDDPAIQNVPLIVGEYHDDIAGGTGKNRLDIPKLLPCHNVTCDENLTFGAFRAERRA